jgi:exodeoxyribonuclease VII small subunit
MYLRDRFIKEKSGKSWIPSVVFLTHNTGLKNSENEMTTKKNFEESLKELESIVAKLESGDFGLEQSLEQFEVGTKLYKVCKEQLSIAEKKISLLTESLKEEEF